MKMLYKIALLTLLSAFVPFAVQAATPSIMLEKSASYALNDTVYAYRVPTQDSLGVIKYFDVYIDLNVNSNGTIATTANVSSFPSKSVTTGVIAPGTYQETGGTDKCTVTNMTLTNGRIQSFFSCTYGTVTRFEFSVATGPLTAGHPYLAELLLKKVNTRTDVGTQTWGIVGDSFFSLGACQFNARGTAIGAMTNGSKIVISVINNSALPNTYCINTLNKI